MRFAIRVDGVLPEDVRRVFADIWLPHDAATEFPVVAAALGDGVHHTTGGTAELGTVAAGLDLELLVHVEGHVAEAQTGTEVGDVEAVDVVRVLGHRGAAERSQVAEVTVTRGGARGKQRHVGHVARDRQAVDHFLGDDRGRFHRGNVDRVDRTRAHNGDCVEGRGVARGADEVDVGGGADVDVDGTRGAAVAADLVLASRQGRETVGAIGAHRDGARDTRRRIGDGDRIARGSAAVGLTGSVALRLDAADEAQTQSDGERAPLQALGKVIRSHVL